jgi:hypothetical protein
MERLQADLPGEAEISEIQANIAKLTAEEEAIKKEGADGSAQ